MNQRTTPYVLVVDDDEPIRTALRLILEEDGYGVIEAENGLDALGILRTDPRPLVVLLDLMMPKMTGVDLLRKIAADPALAQRRAFMVLTASWRTNLLEQMHLPEGFSVPIFPKPMDIDQLLENVMYAASDLDRRCA